MVRFPFSDLSRAKLRPALLLAPTGYGDWLLSQITSNPFGDDRAIALTDESFEEGSLEVASPSLIRSRVGVLKPNVFNAFIDEAIRFLEDHRMSI